MIQIDMPMPETCKECFMLDGVFCKASNYKRISYPELETKAEWCPLHEVTAGTDTISRQQAINAICDDWCGYTNANCPYGSETEHYCEGCDAVCILKTLPPSPSRPQGKWIRHHEITDGNDIINGYMCNQCKRVVEVHSWETLSEKYPFCHCGADMRGGAV